MTAGSLRKTKRQAPIVLMYHGTPRTNPSSPYSIRSDKFVEHLNYLKSNGWHTALASDLINRHSDPLPDKTVLLTFDDGYADNYEGAFLPLLEQGMTASWYITTHCINDYAQWMGANCCETKMLNESQINEMAQEGMEIGAHTCSHPDLTTIPYTQQLAEVLQSKSRLEKIIKKEVSSFAYPYGRVNEDAIKSVRTADYQLAFTVKPGFYNDQEDPLLIRRVTIFSTDSVATLKRKLQFADNDVSWKKVASYYSKRVLSRVQRLSKTIK